MKIEERNRKQCFEVPEGYFEDFGQKLAGRLPMEKPRKRIVPALYRYVGYAASIALLLFIGIALLPEDENSVATVSAPESNGNTEIAAATTESETLTDDDIDNILNNYPIDDYTFYCYMTDSEF